MIGSVNQFPYQVIMLLLVLIRMMTMVIGPVLLISFIEMAAVGLSRQKYLLLMQQLVICSVVRFPYPVIML